jgi:hypothetical protein
MSDTKSGYYLPGVGAFDWYSDEGPPEGALDAFPEDDTARPVCYRTTEDRPFHIGPSYDKPPVQMIVCVKCGGSSFEVGKAAFYTAIRCVTCQWEVCTHEG